MSSTKYYPLAAGLWPGTEVVEVYDVNNTRICTIPINFLQESGDRTWLFAFYCIRACVDHDGTLVHDDDVHNTAIDPASAVVPGRYLFLRQGDFLLLFLHKG